MQNTKCKMQSAKYKVQNRKKDCNCECECGAFLYLSPIFLISFFFPFPTSVTFSQLGALQDAPGNV